MYINNLGVLKTLLIKKKNAWIVKKLSLIKTFASKVIILKPL